MHILFMVDLQYNRDTEALQSLWRLYCPCEVMSMWLRVKKVKDGFVLYNATSGTHAHFQKEGPAQLCKKLLLKGTLPDNEGLRESCRRLISRKAYREHERRSRETNAST